MTQASRKGYMAAAKRSDWGTPQKLFDELHERFNFTVDAAANDLNHKLPRWWGPGTGAEHPNGLDVSWSGERVFCNPPYGRGISHWCSKAWLETNATSVLLLPVRTDTAWFHEIILPDARATIRYIRGRLKFEGAEYPAPFPSMLVIWD